MSGSIDFETFRRLERHDYAGWRGEHGMDGPDQAGDVWWIERDPQGATHLVYGFLEISEVPHLRRNEHDVEAAIERHRPPRRQAERPASAAALFHLNELRLLREALRLQALAEGHDPGGAPFALVVVSKQIAWVVLSDAMRKGARF